MTTSQSESQSSLEHATENCFFCHQSIPENHPGWRRVQTSEDSKNIEKWARALNRTDLIADLIMKGSDLHAADAVYHVRCYVQMSNSYRSLVRKQSHTKSETNTSIHLHLY